MRILCVGINHKTAAVGLREKLAFDTETARRAMATLAEQWDHAEFVILSTCNRTELYTARPVHGHPRDHELRDWLARFGGVAVEDLAESLYTLSDAEAVGHLFTVAAGLDSLVPGEDQIVTQIKDAYAAAAEIDAVGAVLNEIVQTALHVAKHVRTETGLAAGKVSVASVAVEFVGHVFETLRDKRVLTVGAGKMNVLMLRHLAELGAGDILVSNRSFDRAERLAAQCGGRPVPFEDLGKHLAASDVVLTGTASEHAIIGREMVTRAQEARNWRPLLIVDIAVPRDVAPECGEIENVFLYNIDDLEGIVRGTIEMRHAERDAAETIIAEHVTEVTARLSVRDVAPTIDALYRAMEAVAAEELKAAQNKLSGHADADADTEILRRALHRTIRRILHPCATQLRESAGTDAARAHIAALRELFRLDEDD